MYNIVFVFVSDKDEEDSTAQGTPGECAETVYKLGAYNKGH